MTNINQESTFRYGMHKLTTEIQPGESVQQAWTRTAQENDLDAERQVDFKQAGDEVLGTDEAQPGITYAVSVALAKNGA